MDDKLKGAYEHYKEKLREVLEEAANIKKILNRMALDSGEQPEFPDEVVDQGAKALVVKPGLFYGKSLPGSVKEYLTMVHKTRGDKAVAFTEIFEALRKGSFGGLKTKTEIEEKTLSLKKNSTTFTVVDEDHIGIKALLPKVKEVKKRKKAKPMPLPRPKKQKPEKGERIEKSKTEVAPKDTETPKQ